MPVVINGTTGITNVDGSAAAPAATGTTSTTTGIYYGTNTVGLATNGTNALFVDASQRVGIGTSSPAEALEISRAAPVIRLSSTAAAGSASTYAVLNATSGNSGNFFRAFIATSDSGATYDWGIGNFGTTTKDVLAFYSGGLTERMRIDSSGNVGIGTTSPTALGAGRTSVNINGSTDSILWMMSNSATTGYIQGEAASFNIVAASNKNLITTASGTGVVYWYTGGSERMRIDTSGNVGIGTTSPASKLDARTSGNGGISGPSTGTWTARVVHNNDASGGNGLSVQNRWAASSSILFECAMGWNGSAAGYYPVFTVDGLGQVIFAPQRTEAMRVDFNGNLLVGTTSTLNSATVCVVSGSGVGLVVRNSTATAGKFWNTPYVNGSNTLYVINQNNTGVYLTDGSTAWAANSDERLKTDLKPIENAAAKVATLRAVTGRFKTDEEGTSRAFLIAQDVQAVLPEAVDATDPERLGVAYADTIPLLVAAIKELKTQNDDLRARVAALEGAK